MIIQKAEKIFGLPHQKKAITMQKNGIFFCTLCSKDTWAFTNPDFPHIDENSLIKTDGPEKDVPHFYVNLEDIQKLFSDFEIIRIRHIDDCYINAFLSTSKSPCLLQ